MKIVTTTAIVCLVTAATLPAAMGAVTLISNVPNSSGLGNQVGSNNWWAEGFSVGSNAGGFQLDSVTLQVQSPQSSMLYASLYSDAGNHPSSLLANLSAAGPFTSVDYYTFLPSSSVNLAAGQNYWVVLTSSAIFNSPGGGRWSVTNEPFTTASGVSYRGVENSPDGTTWSGFLFDSTHGFAVAATPTAVPEPASGVFGFACLAGALLRCRRKYTRPTQRR